MDQYERLLQEKLEAYRREKESKIRPNIMILGRTGCGKSSLVNRVFPAANAYVSSAHRGTTDFRTYSDGKINLIDSKGYEMDSEYHYGVYEEASYDRFVKSVVHYLNERAKRPEERIHIVWYCINIGGERIEEYDLKMLHRLCHIEDVKRHTAIVLTKCDLDDHKGSTARAFKEQFQMDGSVSYLPVFETSTQMGKELLELKQLISWSEEALNDMDVSGELREGFVASQMQDLDSKWESVVRVIRNYAMTAAGIGATPIPVSDAVLLTAEQTVMCAHIISIYNLDALASISRALVGDVFLSNMGKTIAGSLMKLIPVVGSSTGCVINAAVASTLTAALGLGVSSICKSTCEQILKGHKVDFNILFTLESIQRAVKAAEPDARILIGRVE